MTLHKVRAYLTVWKEGRNTEAEERIFFVKARSYTEAQKTAKAYYLNVIAPGLVHVDFPERIKTIKGE
jgi:hypothetical protein